MDRRISSLVNFISYTLCQLFFSQVNTASMRSVRKVAFPVPFFSRRASGRLTAHAHGGQAVQTAAKGSDGHGAAEGANQGGEHTTAAGDAGHGGAAFRRTIVCSPSEMTSRGPDRAMMPANAPGQPRDRLDSGR